MIYILHIIEFKKKKKCYPEIINSSELGVSVPLQELLNHTAKRVLLYLDNVINSFKKQYNNNNDEMNTVFLFKYVFDGSSNHNLHNIKTEKKIDEGNMIPVFFCPIKLFIEQDGSILWNNKSPNSPKFCRPLKLMHKAETKENLKSLHDDIKTEINSLQTLKIANINKKFQTLLTMLDGKAIKAIMGDSSPSVCKICIPSTTLNTLECMLHISYPMKLKCWSVRGETNKKVMFDEKQYIYIYIYICKSIRNSI